uniref:Uncharacterized protein n=1 Tax=Ficedula albicollis TaxID=59894 RepID=A0A803W3R4_FICAL
MGAHFQYVLAVGEANIVSFQNLLNEKEVAGECYTNFAEESTMSPATFSTNLSYVEEKNRNSDKDSFAIVTNKLLSILSLNRKKMRFFQLLSDLKGERSRCFKEMAKVLQFTENYVAEYDELLQERKRNLQRIALSEGEKETLMGHLAEIKCEQDKYRTLVSELQACKTGCYQTFSNLQEEKCVLKREIDRINQETSEQLDELQNANANFTLEKKIKELKSSLGFTYEELRKEESIGTKENTVKLEEESQQPGLKPKKAETACCAIQTEEQGVLAIDPSDYSPVKKAQKWYRELGFAETRYEETKTHLKQALSELDRLKREVQDKMQEKQHCKLMPVTLKDGWEKEVYKKACKRLELKVLAMKAELRDKAALRDLQIQVKFLQAHLYEKEKELQKTKSEMRLTLAPLKAKLACLTQKCQERNSFIRRMHDEFHKQGFINSAFDEEMKNLVNDTTLAEYTVAFTPMCDQEASPLTSL